jgi:O-antigen/teichoic acid export membrane protein
MPLIMGRGICEFLSRTLFGMGKYRIPLAATALALAINLLVCAILPNRYPVLIGLGAVLGFLAGAIVILVYLRRLRLAD